MACQRKQILVEELQRRLLQHIVDASTGVQATQILVHTLQIGGRRRRNAQRAFPRVGVDGRRLQGGRLQLEHLLHLALDIVIGLLGRRRQRPDRRHAVHLGHGALECVDEPLLDVVADALDGLAQLEMHALAALVVRNEHRSQRGQAGTDERLDAIGDRIVWMEYIVESIAGGQLVVEAQSGDAAHCHEHACARKYKNKQQIPLKSISREILTNGRAKRKELFRFEIQLRIPNKRLTRSSLSHGKIGAIIGHLCQTGVHTECRRW